MNYEEAMKYCEDHTCDECSCVDIRTKKDRVIGQIPCFYNLVDEWRNEKLVERVRTKQEIVSRTGYKTAKK